jgi:hypothetical protein
VLGPPEISASIAALELVFRIGPACTRTVALVAGLVHEGFDLGVPAGMRV